MKIIRYTSEFRLLNPVISTIGTFDGFHLGHQQLIAQMIKKKEVLNLPLCLLTFEPHPKLVLNKDSEPRQLLTTTDEKINRLQSFGIDVLVVYPFTSLFSEWSPEMFFNRLIVQQMQTRCLFMGYDHRFGKNREGNAQSLGELADTKGVELESCPAVYEAGIPISSTRIRKALQTGQIDTATRLLGTPYTITGKVVRGKGRGGTRGVPTANIEISDAYKCIPAQGVYLVKGQWDSKKNYFGMMNIGVNPTFEKIPVLHCEVHFFEFEGNLYGQDLIIHFLEYLRAEQRFNSADALYRQIEQDAKQCQNLMAQKYH